MSQTRPKTEEEKLAKPTYSEIMEFFTANKDMIEKQETITNTLKTTYFKLSTLLQNDLSAIPYFLKLNRFLEITFSQIEYLFAYMQSHSLAKSDIKYAQILIRDVKDRIATITLRNYCYLQSSEGNKAIETSLKKFNIKLLINDMASFGKDIVNYLDQTYAEIAAIMAKKDQPNDKQTVTTPTKKKKKKKKKKKPAVAASTSSTTFINDSIKLSSNESAADETSSSDDEPSEDTQKNMSENAEQEQKSLPITTSISQHKKTQPQTKLTSNEKTLIDCFLKLKFENGLLFKNLEKAITLFKSISYPTYTKKTIRNEKRYFCRGPVQKFLECMDLIKYDYPGPQLLSDLIKIAYGSAFELIAAYQLRERCGEETIISLSEQIDWTEFDIVTEKIKQKSTETTLYECKYMRDWPSSLKQDDKKRTDDLINQFNLQQQIAKDFNYAYTIFSAHEIRREWKKIFSTSGMNFCEYLTAEKTSSSASFFSAKEDVDDSSSNAKSNIGFTKQQGN